MYLEVILEQGILGAIALVWAIFVVAGWAWKAASRRHQPSPQTSAIWGLGWAGLFALSIAAVHGIFDVVFYVERTLPVVGLLLGMAYYSQIVEIGSDEKTVPIRRRFSMERFVIALAVFSLAIFVAVTFFRDSLLSAWYANLGAVEQTRQELPNYDPNHFDNPTLDEIRRTVDLERAVSFFYQSLAWQPGNPTALQRLAGLALARGQYDQALAQMKAAYEAGHFDSSTRLILGDTLVATGYPKDAAELVRGIRWAETRLTGQAFYRYWLGVPPDPPDYQRAIWAADAALVIDPSNSSALWVKSQAERMLNRQK
jgi:tetratricopeptide (TPR) repeat protein